MKKHLREWAVTAALGAFLLVLAVAAPGFYKPAQLIPTLAEAAPILLLSAGMAVVIITRQIDISVASVFAACSVVGALAAQSGAPTPVVVLVAVLSGALCGAINGALVAGLQLPSIVVTLATMITWRETLRWWREGEFVRDLPQSFQWFGLSQSAGRAVIIGSALLIFVLFAWALRHLAAGRFVYAVGSDSEAARLAGISPRWITFGAFALMGALTGAAALLSSARFPDVDPKTGTGHEMRAIAAVVVGGVSISGGRGSLWGVLAGAFLLALISPALVFLGGAPQWERVIQGAVILLAVAAEGWKRR